MAAACTYLLSTGTIAIDTTDLLSDVENEWLAAFGATLDLDASTPQGTMIAAETTSRAAIMKNNSDLANMQNPNLAYGVFLDAICALLGIERGTNISTEAAGIEMLGDAGTLIPAGSRVSTVNGDIMSLLEPVVIPPGGATTGTFLSAVYGPILVPPGPLTIIDGTLGWGAAISGAGTTVTPGSAQATDPELKNKRNEQLSVQGTASTAAVYANLLNVPNVTSAQVIENNIGAPGVIHGVTFRKGNALWVCVAGNPFPSSVAAALYAAHNSGCAWDFGAAGNGVPVNGPDGVVAIDPTTGLQYFVKYMTPILFDTYIHITIRQAPSQSPGASAIAQSILAYCQGLTGGEPGLVVGASLSAFDVSGAVNRAYPGLYVQDCRVAAVPEGSPAPAYPADYVLEWVANQFQQGIQQIGLITVVLTLSMIPYDPAITRALKWMQNQAPRITSIINQKQTWYDRYNTQFWQNWEATVFDLQTANPFGLVVWCIILGLPLDLFSFVPITNAFAYGPQRGNYIDSGGNVPPMVFTDGPEIYADGGLVDAGDYSLNLPSGDITFVTAPAVDTILEWAGTVENEQGTEIVVVPGRVFGLGDGVKRTFLMTAPNPDDFNQIGYNFQGGGNESVAILSEVRYACQLRYAALVSNGRQQWINEMLAYIFNGGEPWDMPSGRYFYLTDSTQNTNPSVLAADTEVLTGDATNFNRTDGGLVLSFKYTPADDTARFTVGDTVTFSELTGADPAALDQVMNPPNVIASINIAGGNISINKSTSGSYVYTGITGKASVTVPALPPVPPVTEPMKMEYHVGPNLQLSAQFINLLNNEAYGIIPQLAGVSYTVIQDA